MAKKRTKVGPDDKKLDYKLGGKRGARSNLKNKTSALGRRKESRAGKRGAATRKKKA